MEFKTKNFEKYLVLKFLFRKLAITLNFNTLRSFHYYVTLLCWVYKNSSQNEVNHEVDRAAKDQIGITKK